MSDKLLVERHKLLRKIESRWSERDRKRILKSIEDARKTGNTLQGEDRRNLKSFLGYIDKESKNQTDVSPKLEAIFDYVKKAVRIERGKPPRIGATEEEEQDETHFVTSNDLDAIQAWCDAKGKIVSIRETGLDSIRRLGEGALPKPHMIRRDDTESEKGDAKSEKLPKLPLLEKSIKNSSVKGAVDSLGEELKLGDLDAIRGLVGAWREYEVVKNGKKVKTKELLGVRVDPNAKAIQAILKEEEGKKLSEKLVRVGKSSKKADGTKESKEAFDWSLRCWVPLDMMEAFREKVGEGWIGLTYTGDYDMGDVLSGSQGAHGGGWKWQPVLSTKIGAIVKELNLAMALAETDPAMKEDRKKKELWRIQHGPQRGYTAFVTALDNEEEPVHVVAEPAHSVLIVTPNEIFLARDAFDYATVYASLGCRTQPLLTKARLSYYGWFSAEEEEK